MSLRIIAPALVLLAALSAPTTASAYYTASHDGAGTTIQAGTVDAGVMMLFNATQRDYPDLQEPNHQGMVSIREENFGGVDTIVSAGPGCEPGFNTTLCPDGPVTFRGGHWNEFVDASAYDGTRHYWLSTSFTAYGMGGADTLSGGRANDYLDGGAKNDRLSGYEGDDTLIAGPGEAMFGDLLRGGAGNDMHRSDNGGSDEIECGPGSDTAIADQWDKLIGCESVTRVARRHIGLVYRAGAYGDLTRGTPGPDKYYGNARSNSFEGLADHDVLYGAGGNDWLAGGKGRDKIYGGGGNDTLNSRDRARGDLVDCGPGRDTAIVDRGDIVRGCEIVKRR